MVTHTAPVYMAAVLEYICVEIIDMASIMAKDDHRVRITVSDLELSIKADAEFSKLFNDNNIRFLGGGVQQWIHPNLLVKKNVTQEKTKKISNGERRYKSGTIAIKDIKKYQKMGNTLIFAKQPFEKFVRQIISDHKTNVKISKNVFSIIQYVIEDYLVNFFIDANAAAIHAGRVKLMVHDLEFVRCNRQGNNFGLINSKNNFESEVESSVIQEQSNEINKIEQVQHEQVHQESVQQEQVQQEQVHQESVHQESVQHESVQHESVHQESVQQEQVHQESENKFNETELIEEE
jgi:histone H3/H4